ncbi:SAP domain-containing ribonucleoprotein-like isoform X2 [Argiope bruennichi]|uniref:SAP domain-containing ribonucleoprotein-like isoform X2 n=1 Tax=Argiope bruennichi TaxID=94029 RepID=UPI00249425E8|nr:SAP domain-containing ribonucleoprotein-like isoform X2 [Argiope bruennichi]
MASKNISASKIKGDTKSVMINDTADAALLSDKKSAVVEEQDSSGFEKGNKSSTPSLKILKTAATAASTSPITTIKKETSDEEEPLSKAPAYKPTRIKLVKTVNQQASEVNSDATASLNEASDGDKKGGANVIRLSVKDLSDEERRKLRAKRFNIIVADTSKSVKKTVTTKAANPISKGISSSSNVPAPSYDILKRRAERFGENVSTVMKSLDHKEKMLKRKLKFLEGATNLKEVEIKKKRAERFRMI